MHIMHIVFTQKIFFFYLRESLINKVFHFINWLCIKKMFNLSNILWVIQKNIGKNPWVKWMYMYNCYSSARLSSMVKGFQSTPLPNRRKSSRPVSVNKRWVTHVVVSRCTIHITRVYVLMHVTRVIETTDIQHKTY